VVPPKNRSISAVTVDCPAHQVPPSLLVSRRKKLSRGKTDLHRHRILPAADVRPSRIALSSAVSICTQPHQPASRGRSFDHLRCARASLAAMARFQAEPHLITWTHDASSNNHRLAHATTLSGSGRRADGALFVKAALCSKDVMHQRPFRGTYLLQRSVNAARRLRARLVAPADPGCWINDPAELWSAMPSVAAPPARRCPLGNDPGRSPSRALAKRASMKRPGSIRRSRISLCGKARHCARSKHRSSRHVRDLPQGHGPANGRLAARFLTEIDRA